MTSERPDDQRGAYVWIWLPGAVTPVVVGRLQRETHGGYAFTDGRCYLDRAEAISLFPTSPVWPPRPPLA
ncbi:hypothetical protein [uncultured Thiocystis sp.]|jgi:serine/threonine-protein kinase HipA|uniref:hypothetical protein n=1 Tax=uncultured Thiocystis sp. TaxID=1202134 RepID=UPI0025D31C03|nr:hypothetical protein [uncultured Thiocystis sp.]